MFGYIKKDVLLKTLREEMTRQEKLGDTYNRLASDLLERKLAAKNDGDRQWYEDERLKYVRLTEEANTKLVEAVTIFNMVKQMRSIQRGV